MKSFIWLATVFVAFSQTPGTISTNSSITSTSGALVCVLTNISTVIPGVLGLFSDTNKWDIVANGTHKQGAF